MARHNTKRNAGLTLCAVGGSALVFGFKTIEDPYVQDQPLVAGGGLVALIVGLLLLMSLAE